MDLDGALVLFSELIETLKCRPMHVDCVHWHYDVDRFTDTPSNTILPVYCIVRVTFRLIHNCFPISNWSVSILFYLHFELSCPASQIRSNAKIIPAN